MEEPRALQLVIEYLEYSFDDFQEFLERVKEIEGSEAELLIDIIGGIYNGKIEEKK